MRRMWDLLNEHEDAAELAALLYEAAPRLGLRASSNPRASRPLRRAVPSSGPSLHERLAAATPMPIGTLGEGILYG